MAVAAWSWSAIESCPGGRRPSCKLKVATYLPFSGDARGDDRCLGFVFVAELAEFFAIGRRECRDFDLGELTDRN